MKKPEELGHYQFSDIDVKYYQDEPIFTIDLTKDNFQRLIDHHNNLVEAFNAMAEHIGFEGYEED